MKHTCRTPEPTCNFADVVTPETMHPNRDDLIERGIGTSCRGLVRRLYTFKRLSNDRTESLRDFVVISRMRE